MGTENSKSLLSASRASAIVLLVQFLHYFWFMQHSLLGEEQAPSLSNALLGAGLAAAVGSPTVTHQLFVEHKRMRKTERQPGHRIWTSLVILPCSIAALTTASLLLLESVDAVVHPLRLSQSFLRLIMMICVLASIDYASGVLRSKPIQVAEIAVEAFLSSVKISLLVFPLAVISGWILNVPMDMLLDGFQVSAVALAALMANHVARGEISHW